MMLFRTLTACALGALAMAGCAAAGREAAQSEAIHRTTVETSRSIYEVSLAPPRLRSPDLTPVSEVAQVGYEEPIGAPLAVGPSSPLDNFLLPPDDGTDASAPDPAGGIRIALAVDRTPSESAPDDPFAGHTVLELELLVAEVHSRNPTLQASLAAWSSAAERYPQVTALEDPMLQSMTAPGTIPSSSNIQPSYYVGIAQKVPWWGKRGLRGQVAQWETNAQAFDSQEVQLRLTEAARVAYFDYYLVIRELELNRDNTAAMQEFRGTANTKYELTQVTQQDVLQADVELAKLESRRIELDQGLRVVRARINTLLHRAPDHPLPAPPAILEVPDSTPPAEPLRQSALARPELAALASRIQAEQASLALACKEFYPDFELMGRYDQFWTDVEQRPQVGVNVNVPLNQSRRNAAVREATFRLQKMQAEYQQQVDNIRHDVEAGLARLEGSRRTVALYVEQILPRARANVESANSGYVAGQVDFLRLIEAERELIDLQEKHQAAIADYHRRQAELERVAGRRLSEIAGPS